MNNRERELSALTPYCHYTCGFHQDVFLRPLLTLGLCETSLETKGVRLKAQQCLSEIIIIISLKHNPLLSSCNPEISNSKDAKFNQFAVFDCLTFFLSNLTVTRLSFSSVLFKIPEKVNIKLLHIHTSTC